MTLAVTLSGSISRCLDKACRFLAFAWFRLWWGLDLVSQGKLFHGENADADYLNFLAQLTESIKKHTPDFHRKVGEFLESPLRFGCNLLAKTWEWMFPTKPKTFSGKLWSYISMS
jgi:hypothetical protein